MVNQGEIKDYLHELVVARPDLVKTNLQRGSKIRKGSLAEYEIDNPDLDRVFGTYAPGAIPLGPIYRGLEPSETRLRQLFEHRRVIPFSEAVNARIGECVEKSILVQLAAQRGEDSFIIDGELAQEGEVGVGHHAFNIVFREGMPILVDAQGPLKSNQANFRGYTAPIQSIENGEITVPKEWKIGRTYFLA